MPMPTMESCLALIPFHSPLIQQLLTYYPIPNNSIGGGLGRYSVVATQVGNEDYILGRVDHMISATDSVFARYIRDRADFTDPFSGSNLPLWPETHRMAIITPRSKNGIFL